ncbi:MAG TPA: hypothetical protein VM238_22895 [Phycisphaerae bacterium]|nr:hypothetical protein [Phycisphaerae bacterium]
MDRTVHFLAFEEFSHANLVRCRESFHELEDWSETDWACAMAGEVGEVCNLIKKRRRGELVDARAIAAELADVVTYADLLARRLDINLGMAVACKFNEVSERVSSPIRLQYELLAERE